MGLDFFAQLYVLVFDPLLGTELLIENDLRVICDWLKVCPYLFGGPLLPYLLPIYELQVLLVLIKSSWH